MKKYGATAADEESCCALLGHSDADEDGNLMEPKMEAATTSTTFPASRHQQSRDDQIHDHCHALLLSRKEDKSAERSLWVVAVLSLAHISAQLVGGFLANSLAIIADSGHILTDLISFLISIYMIRVSRVYANRRYTFGYLRAEFIGALASLFIIWTITILMIIFATQRIISGEMEVNTDIMLITAAIGIAFNLVMVLFLKCSKGGASAMHSHGHSHLGAHSHAHAPGENVNIRAAFIHILGDFIQSIGLLCAALVIRWTNFQLADPLCTYLFSLVVLATSIPVAWDIFLTLMEATPQDANYDVIKKDLASLNSVTRIHSLHLWVLSTEQRAAAVHLVIDDESKAVPATKAATALLQHKHNFHFTTIQIEPVDSSSVHSHCKFCRAK